MRIPSGKTDIYAYFLAVDINDYVTRKTGLTSFTVYRSRNGSAAAIYTTPTVVELSAANMPGVYALLIDEDTTIASTSDSEEYAVQITQASMAPVSRTIELYRRDTTSGQTLTVASGHVSVVDTLTTYTGNTVQTGDAFARVGAPAGASVSADIAAVEANAVAIKAKTDNLPAAPASTTNITAGTITTVTNLTNAPTVGDLTAAMKTSVTTAATAATPAAASVTGSVGSVVGLTASDVAAIKAKTDNLPPDPADESLIIAATNALAASIAALPTANTNADALLDRTAGVETNRTLRQSLRLMLSAMCGKASGLSGTTATYRDTNDTVNRIVATVDSSGDRSAVTLDAS